ncbi:MAG: peptidase M23 [Proteobacteria bacterium SW_6_67_9]|nr:MAG: peptidase M23 [Proteobacteria bacterium SW_6_67_9]
MNNNKRSQARSSPINRPNPHWRLRWLALGLGLLVLGMVMASTQAPGQPSPRQTALPSGAPLEHRQLALPERPQAQRRATAGTAEPAQRRALAWRELVVERGDALARLLREAGVAQPTIHALVRARPHGAALSRIRPGDRIRLALDGAGSVQRLVLQRQPDRRLVFNREADHFASARVHTPLERRLEHASGVIDESLSAAGGRAGLSDGLITDQHVRDGAIVAAEFVNRGERHRAVRYTDHDGAAAYFAPDGTSMRKAFLRTPVEFTRISSGYGQRYHPKLGRMSNHHGVDYAAAPGTPIRATGSGRIAFRGRNGAYGRFIVIRHGERYSTAYGHMRGFASGRRTGSRVSQGDVIGYVGNSGRSTGPHLHYEFRVNGAHKNPLRVSFPPMDTIPSSQRVAFDEKAQPRLAMLDTLARTFAALDR